MKSDGRECPARKGLVPAEAVFAAWIPDLPHRTDAFRVNTSEVDDEILALFFEQLAQNVSALAHAIAHRDTEGVRENAHSLQGTGGTVGAPELSVVGVELSAAARRGDFDRCAGLLGALHAWLRRQGRQTPERGAE